MPKTACLYIDDSGTRNPNYKLDPKQFRDWFGLGGVLLNEEDEDAVRRAHEEFCKRWHITYPLHSYDIRQREGRFSWLNTVSQNDYKEFMRTLTDFLVELPLIGHGCVIDRPGYDARYREKYGRQTWNLCKTAFAVICERAAKLARADGRKLRVYPEEGDATADYHVRGYYAELRTVGMPFKGDDASKYAALTASELRETLYDLKFKRKDSPLAQIADIYLYPICRGRYQSDYWPYVTLRDHGKLIDTRLTAETIPHIGIKYSCFELVDASPDTPRAGVTPGSDAAPVTGTS